MALSAAVSSHKTGSVTMGARAWKQDGIGNKTGLFVDTDFCWLKHVALLRRQIKGDRAVRRVPATRQESVLQTL